MPRYMTVEECEQYIEDGLEERARLGFGYGALDARFDGRVAGCALCVLYAGVGGCDRAYTDLAYGGQFFQRDFLQRGLTAPPIRQVDLANLEMGYENFESLFLDPDSKQINANSHSAFFKLGKKFKDIRRGY